MELLTINNVDFTAKVVDKSYQMDQKPVYTTWQDADYRTRRTVVRTRISGKFTMNFTSENDYAAFESAIAAAMVNGDYVPITVYVNNLKTTTTINAFVDYTTKLLWSYESTRTPHIAVVSVKITER